MGMVKKNQDVIDIEALLRQEAEATRDQGGCAIGSFLNNMEDKEAAAKLKAIAADPELPSGTFGRVLRRLGMEIGGRTVEKHCAAARGEIAGCQCRKRGWL